MTEHLSSVGAFASRHGVFPSCAYARDLERVGLVVMVVTVVVVVVVVVVVAAIEAVVVA